MNTNGCIVVNRGYRGRVVLGADACRAGWVGVLLDDSSSQPRVCVAPTIAALLAEALYRLGRFEEAESFNRKAEELGSEDDVWTQSIWRCVRAKVLAREAGTQGQAISLAHEAIEILRTADAPVWLANGLCDSADVFGACGEPAQAKALLAQALALYERKQAPVPAERVRTRLFRSSLDVDAPVRGVVQVDLNG